MQRCWQDLERATKCVAYFRQQSRKPCLHFRGREQLPKLGESSVEQPPERCCAFRRGLQAKQNQGNETQLCSPPSLCLLLVTRLSEPNQKQEGWGAHGYSQHLGSLSKVGTWIEGTFQQMGNNQYRHLLVKNILIASDKAYPNLTETKRGIYWKS